MNDLREMIQFIGPKQLQKSTFLGKSHKSSAQNELLALLIGGKKEEEALALKIQDRNLGPAYLTQLKSKLKLSLINHLFFLDNNEALFKNFSQAFKNCRKLIYAAEILYTKGARSAGIGLAEKAFRMAEKFELIDICDTAGQFLRNAYRVTGDKRKLKEFRAKSDYYHNLFGVQREVKKIFFDLSEDFEMFIEVDEDYNKYLADTEAQLVQLLSAHNGPFIVSYGYSALCAIKSKQQNFAAVIDFSKEGIERLSQYHFLPKIFILALYDGIIKAAMSMGNFEIGNSTMAESKAFLNQIKGVNLVFLKENFIILAIRTGNYEAAISIYQEVTSSQIFKKVPPVISETWEMFAAYLFLLKLMNRVADKNNVLQGFRMAKFLNAADNLQSDKLGYNFSFLLLNTSYALYRKDYDEIFNSMDRLKSYNYKYLRKEESVRAQYFVKMMLTLPDTDFHKVAVERKSKKWLDRLTQIRTTASVDAIKGEIIPFELHWEIITDLLEPKFNPAKRK